MGTGSSKAGRVALVMGVGPGLGTAIARRFARGGFSVALFARKRGSFEAALQELTASGAAARGYEVDVTSPGEVKAAITEVIAELGPVDVLVYNAGAFAMGGILDVTPEQFEHCFRANCLGAFLGAQGVLPGMLEKGRGTLLLTGATAALRGSAGFSCLAVGKFGLRALAQSLAREFGPRGIHVAHVIIDGQIDTPRLRAASPSREPHTVLAPDAIAETYFHLHDQHPTAWTLELDLRPSVERF
jgi:NAD(P)-dependent dehydrogenase (short-subunit alcohol dehydrogenase family)